MAIGTTRVDVLSNDSSINGLRLRCERMKKNSETGFSKTLLILHILSVYSRIKAWPLRPSVLI